MHDRTTAGMVQLGCSGNLTIQKLVKNNGTLIWLAGTSPAKPYLRTVVGNCKKTNRMKIIQLVIAFGLLYLISCNLDDNRKELLNQIFISLT